MACLLNVDIRTEMAAHLPQKIDLQSNPSQKNRVGKSALCNESLHEETSCGHETLRLVCPQDDEIVICAFDFGLVKTAEGVIVK